MGDSNILHIISKCMTSERFERVVSYEQEYIKRNKTLMEAAEQLQKYNLTREQRRQVDRYVTASNECNFRYSELAYIQGIKDCVAILLEMGLIKSTEQAGVDDK